MGFLIHKNQQFWKHFAETFYWSQTSYFWREKVWGAKKVNRKNEKWKCFLSIARRGIRQKNSIVVFIIIILKKFFCSHFFLFVVHNKYFALQYFDFFHITPPFKSLKKKKKSILYSSSSSRCNRNREKNKYITAIHNFSLIIQQSFLMGLIIFIKNFHILQAFFSSSFFRENNFTKIVVVNAQMICLQTIKSAVCLFFSW